MAPADLTGLTPYVDYSKKLMDEAFPGGKAGFDDQTLRDEINKQLWGTGTTPGVYSQFARRGLSEQQPEVQYATSRVVKDSMQELLNQYQTRQIAALNAGRTATLAEPTFRVSEAGASGYYEGSPTPQTAYVNAIERNAAELRKREDMKLLAGGVVGAATQGVVGNLINMGFSGLSAGAKALWEWMSGGTISEADKAEVLANQAVYQQEIEQLTNQLAEWGPGFNAGANPVDLSGAWPGAGYDPYNPGDLSWLSPSASTPAAGAGAGVGAGAVNWTPELINAIYGGASAAGAGAGASMFAGGAGSMAAAVPTVGAPLAGAGAGAFASALPFAALAAPLIAILTNRDPSGAIEDADAKNALNDILRNPGIAEEMIRNPWSRERSYRSAMENHPDPSLRSRFVAALGGTSIDYSGSPAPTGDAWHGSPEGGYWFEPR